MNNEAAVTMCFGLPALNKNKIGLKNIPPPIPTTPETNPSIPPIKTEIIEGIFKLKKNKTVLIVAHRLSTVSICDELFKLDKGKIIQKGKFEEITNLKKY